MTVSITCHTCDFHIHGKGPETAQNPPYWTEIESRWNKRAEVKNG
jgi:hypothetical protein